MLRHQAQARPSTPLTKDFTEGGTISSKSSLSSSLNYDFPASTDVPKPIFALVAPIFTKELFKFFM